MVKKPFVTKEKLEEIAAQIPTPFHIYDEKGLSENARAVQEAFAWNPGFREYFAVKAKPTRLGSSFSANMESDATVPQRRN